MNEFRHRSDPAFQALQKALSGGGADIASGKPPDVFQPPRRGQDDAAYSLPQLKGTILEVDVAAALVVLEVPFDCAGTKDIVDGQKSVANFRGMPLLSPGGSKVGVVSSASVDDSNVFELQADLNNSNVIDNLVSGMFTGVAIIAQSLSRRPFGQVLVHVIKPLSVRLVQKPSDVNSDLNTAEKTFLVRHRDGHLRKHFFGPVAHAGTGVGSGIGAQVDTFKKILAGGGRPLTGNELAKLSGPRNDEPQPLRKKLEKAARSIKRDRKKRRKWQPGFPLHDHKD